MRANALGLDVPMLPLTLSPKQKELMKAHGSPGEFATAVVRAYYQLEITKEEAVAAVQKYNREWEEAGIEPAEVSVP